MTVWQRLRTNVTYMYPRHSTRAVEFRSIRPLEIAVHVNRLTLASPRLLNTLPMTSLLRLIGLRSGVWMAKA